jgi:hypothetical protein
MHTKSQHSSGVLQVWLWVPTGWPVFVFLVSPPTPAMSRAHHRRANGLSHNTELPAAAHSQQCCEAWHSLVDVHGGLRPLRGPLLSNLVQSCISAPCKEEIRKDASPFVREPNRSHKAVSKQVQTAYRQSLQTSMERPPLTFDLI